jgi:hypothetical protein
VGEGNGRGDRGSRPGPGGDDFLARRLAELRREQAHKRLTLPDGLVETDELHACKLLAHRVFGDRGVIEFDTNPLTNKRMGPLCMGYFVDPPLIGRPGVYRRVRILFKGNGHRELLAQVNVWAAAGGGTA